MRDQPSSIRNNGGSFYHSLHGLATTVALAAAVLATPELFRLTADPLYAFFSRSWGEDLAAVLIWVFALLEGLAIFYGARAFLSIAAVTITLALLSRGLVLA